MIATAISLPAQPNPTEVKASLWEDFQRLDFQVDGRSCLLVLPRNAAPGKPWIWRTEFFGHEPQADLALVGKGFHLAYIDVQNLYGAPIALNHMDRFYSYLTNEYGLASRPVLEGLSRGGLFAFNWAARHPEEVACLYVDAPVCDFKSWPAGWGHGQGSPADWARCKEVYGLNDEQARAYRLNPVDNLAPLAAHHIPILSVCGDADEVVPFDENTRVVQERYAKLGGPISVIVKPGVNHHPHSLKDPTLIVDFILRAVSGRDLGGNERAGLGLADNGPIAYTTADWPVTGLGNARARVLVSQADNPEVVWAHVPWRRRDAHPEGKEAILIDAATGQRVTNVLRAKITAEAGDFLFHPPTAPGEYYLYYLPFRTAGEWYFPSTLYLSPTNRASFDWSRQCQPAVAALKDGGLPAVPRASVLEIQAVNEFHRFSPMEVAATSVEIRQLLEAHRTDRYLLFPEDRRYPIRMNETLPVRWVQLGPGHLVQGEALPGEFYTFQVGIYASQQPIEDLKVDFEDLVSSSGTHLPQSALRCFNLSGTNWLGARIQKRVDVAQGQVQALWFGVDVPDSLPAQTYRGKMTLRSANAPARTLELQLAVAGQKLADRGDGELWRQSRLRWLDSTIGLDDEVFSPYTPVRVDGRSVAILGRKVHFNARGLLESIQSTFTRNVDGVDAPPRELLAGPIDFVVETATGVLPWSGAGAEVVQQSSGAVAWQASSEAAGLSLECSAKMECDGYINYRINLRAEHAVEVKDIRLDLPLRRQAVPYMMGLGCKGGTRPASWHWKWDPARSNNQFWLGDVDGGLSCKFKHLEDRWDLYNLKETGPYRDWSNHGQGGCDVVEAGDRVVVRAYSGARRLAAGETLHFNFGLLITPVKTLDKAHWGWRYYHRGSSSPIEEIAKTGASLVNLHQGDALNPYINYPFLTVDKLSAYTREAHARQMKVKLYYTIRELSDYTAEFWPLRSLGNEVFTDGPGFRVADQFSQNKPAAALPKTGDSWLCEHVLSGYVPAWHTPLGNGHVDAAIATTGLSRWHNYYLEGLSWLIRNAGVDGLYLDGVGYDREIMKRVRKVMQRSRPGCLIDFHSGNNFHPEYGLNNCANQYLELFPCIDSLWFGEGFNYNEPPDYWMVEMAGLPYGLFGEMLQGGGNPWRGMLFGMTSRLGWGGDPRPLWKVWDEFGIQDASMRGYWDDQCPVKTDSPDVFATAYLKPGRNLIALASWATNTTRIHLKVDTAALGLNAAKAHLYAPAIQDFQPETRFNLGDAIPVLPGRGWLLLLDEVDRPASAPADSQP